MKKLFGPILVFLFPMLVYAQQIRTIDSKVNGVTVFLNKAQVTRTAKTTVPVGTTELIFTGITSLLDPESIQAGATGNLIILGVHYRDNFLSEFNMPARLKMLTDSIEIVQKQLMLEANKRDILNKEEQMIMSNQKVGGSQQNVTAAELKAVADFFRNRLAEIGKARIESEEAIKKYSGQIEKLSKQVNEERDTRQRQTGEIVVSVSAPSSTTSSFEISYVVADAGWSPAYDLRATNTKSPVQLSYKANVYQATGESWDNVKLVLSTANPNLGGYKPELFTWYLNEFRPMPTYRSMAAAKMQDGAMEVAEDMAETVANYVSTIQTSLNTEFEISLPYTVASSGKPTVVDIRSIEMKSDYRYAVVPKLDNDAFLIANVTGWEDFDLLPGTANVFFEGTFVAKTYIDPQNIGDTLQVSLGRDKRIVVKREKLKDYTTKRLIGANQREAFAWEISVRNTKGEPVTIRIEDQVPVSQSSQIEVTLEDAGSAQYDPITGKLTWELTLQPNETKKVSFRFGVKYPKGMNISIW